MLGYMHSVGAPLTKVFRVHRQEIFAQVQGFYGSSALPVLTRLEVQPPRQYIVWSAPAVSIVRVPLCRRPPARPAQRRRQVEQISMSALVQLGTRATALARGVV